MKISQAKSHDIERKDHVPDDVRTKGKDEAADWIQENVIDEERWPMDMQDIAEEMGYSRQHVTNTIRDYFEVEGAPIDLEISDGRAHIEFDVPPSDDPDTYVRGYLRGWLDASER